jgi:hypothetical protein
MPRLFAIALLIALALAARSQAQPRRASDYGGLYRDIYSLLHRSTDFASRQAAIKDLTARGPSARLAIPALLTEVQSRGLLVDDAMGALSKILKPAEYAALRDDAVLTPGDLTQFSRDVLHAAISVESLPAAEHLLYRKDPGLRALGINAILQIARLDPVGMDSLSLARKHFIVRAADQADRATPAPHSRPALVRLLYHIGWSQSAAIPPLLRAMLDDDPVTRELAEMTLRLLTFAGPTFSPQTMSMIAHAYSNMWLALADAMVDQGDPRCAALAATLLADIPDIDARRTAIAAAVVNALARGDLDVIPLIDQWNLGKDDLVTAATYALDRAADDDERHRLLQGLWRAGAHTVAVDHPQFSARLGLLLLHDDATLRHDAGQLLLDTDHRIAALQALQSMMAQLPPATFRALRGNAPPRGPPAIARRAEPTPIPPAATVPAPVAAFYLKALQRLAAGGRADSQETLAALKGLKQTARGEWAAARETLRPLLRHRDSAIRATAAELLNTPEDLAIARTGDALADVHSESPTLRATAARQLHALNVLPPRLTNALIKAVDNRDLAAREGLLRALEDAYFNKTDAIASLKALANDTDPAQKAYARAALRQIAN